MARRIAFRVDASLQIGTGHVMRCLTLADALRSDGFVCHFVCRGHPGNLLDRIRQNGHELTVLPSAPPDSPAWQASSAQHGYAGWLGCDWTTDATETRAALQGLQGDWLIVDHYALDARWETALASCYRRLMVIDDLADRPHACDLLLDQSLGRGRDDYVSLVPTSCTILVGARYALLRPEFAELRSQSLSRREVPRLEHVVISIGGVDQGNATARILEVIESESLLPGCTLSVVLGSQAPWLDSVRRQVERVPAKIKMLVDVTNMASLLAGADLAIGAAGATSWERCCLGVPSIVLVSAENQRLVAAALAAAGAALILDDPDHIADRLPLLLKRLQDDLSSLSRLGDASARITEGLGTGLVQEFLRG